MNTRLKVCMRLLVNTSKCCKRLRPVKLEPVILNLKDCTLPLHAQSKFHSDSGARTFGKAVKARPCVTYGSAEVGLV